jgi:AcrR family transcriptional regulator
MAATIDELAASGYGALTLDAVAKRAAVTRSTVYRRWPSKSALVKAAILSVADAFSQRPDTGSVRADLLELMDARRGSKETRARRAIAVALVTPPCDAELSSTLRALRRRASAPLIHILRRAVEREELPRDVDLELIWAPIFAVLSNELLLDRPRSPRFWEGLIDTLLLGARAHHAAAGQRRPATASSGV